MTPRHLLLHHHHHLPAPPPLPPPLQRAPWPPTGAGGLTAAPGSRRRWPGRPWASVWEVLSGEVQSWRNSSPGAATAVLWSCSQGSVGPGREKTEGKPNTGKKVSAFIVLLIRLSWADQLNQIPTGEDLDYIYGISLIWFHWSRGKYQIWDWGSSVFGVPSLLAPLIPGSVINCISGV